MASFVVAALSVANVTLVDVFSAGEAGYACFRLPSVLPLNPSGVVHDPVPLKGAVAVFAEGRLKSCSDFAPTDVVYKMSGDGGRTWGNLTVLAGTDHDAAYGNSSHNPCPVVAGDGRIVVLFDRGGRVLAARSRAPPHAAALDTGWSYRTQPTGASGTTGPTAGIRLPSGRLAVYVDHGGGGALLSDDDGATWRHSNTTVPYGNEGQLALAPNGSLIAAMRDAGVPGGAGSYRRLLSWSSDGGDTWSFPLDALMPELGGSCEGSVLRVATPSSPPLPSQPSPWLLTSTPWGVGPSWDRRCPGPGRCNMTVFRSRDSGASWGVHLQLNESLGVNPREAAAYSALFNYNKTHFGIVYERDGAGHLTMSYLPLPVEAAEESWSG